jgi:hypothetical protein
MNTQSTNMIPESNSSRVCADCIHFERSYYAFTGGCLRNAKRVRDLVDGDWHTKYVLEARSERFLPLSDRRQEADRCGADGKHFVARSKQVPNQVSWFRRIFGSPKSK